MLEMSRRGVLGKVSAGIGIGLAGCTSTPAGDDRSPPTPVTGGRRRSATRGSEAVPDLPFGFDVSVLQSFSATYAARIRISLTYTGRVSTTIEGGDPIPFSGLYGSRGADGLELMIVPEDPYCTRLHDDVTDRNGSMRTVIHQLPETPPDGCWSVDYGQMQCLLMLREELEPGETVAHTYTVLGYQTDTCLPSGTYGFEDWIAWRPPDEVGSGGEEIEIVLRFSITLNDAGDVSVSASEPVYGGLME